MKKRGLLLLLFFLAAYTILAVTFTSPLPVDSNLYFAEKPTLNKNFELVFEFTTLEDLQDVQARILLVDPENEEPLFQSFILVEGELEWSGDLAKGEKIILKPTLITNESGYYKVRADIDAGEFQGKSHRLYPRILKVEPALAKGEVENGWKSTCGFGSDIYDEKINADLNIVFTKLPELNSDVGIIASVLPHEDMDNYRFNLVLPRKGFEVINAESNKRQAVPLPSATVTGVEVCPVNVLWEGSLKKDELLEIKLHAKIINPGWGTLVFRSSKTIRDNDLIYTKGIRKKLDLIVDKEFSKISSEVCQTEDCLNFQNSIVPETSWQKIVKIIKKFFVRIFRPYVG